MLFTYAFGAFLSAISWSYQSLLIARFIAGLGIGAQFPVAFALLAEFAPKRLRHIFVALGPCVTAWAGSAAPCCPPGSFLAFGWRAIYWLGIAPVLMTIYIWRFLPESPRFLLMHGRAEEAGHVVKDLARRAGLTDIELVPPPDSRRQRSQNFASKSPHFALSSGPSSLWVASILQTTFRMSAFLPGCRRSSSSMDSR